MRAILNDIAATFWRVIQFYFFRRPAPQQPPPRWATIALGFSTFYALYIIFELFTAGPNLTFNPYGLTAVIATLALYLALLVAFLTGSDRTVFWKLVTDLCFMSVIFMIPLFVFMLQTTSGDNATATESASCIACIAGLIIFIWGLAATVFVARFYLKGRVRFPATGVLAAAFVPYLIIPFQPVIYGDKTDWTRYDVWQLWKDYVATDQQTETEAQSKKYVLPFDYEAAIYRQRELVERVLSGIKPSASHNESNIFFLAAAPYASQDVFKREVIATKEIFDRRFKTRNRSAVLINHVDTAVTLPMANTHNLEALLNGFAKSMNVDRDVLVLYLTTHGTKGELSVEFPGFTFNTWTPDTLATLLDQAQIKNRVLIISACHSGSFIPRLKDPHTLIMTASHADKTSFGCSNERHWTYFGDALLNRALRQTYSLEKAFHTATGFIRKWEDADGVTPSDPQISVGKEVSKLWSEIEKSFERNSKPALTETLTERDVKKLL